MHRYFIAIVAVLVFASPLYALPATRTLSGTVTYKGERKGRIYITARTTSYNSRGSSSYATSITEPGAFEIRGVSADEEYEVTAVMAVDGHSVYSVSAPVAPTVFVYPDAGTGLTLDLQDLKGAFCAPPYVVVYPQDGGLLVHASSSSACRNFTNSDGVVINWSTDENFKLGYGISYGLVTVPLTAVEAFIPTKKGDQVFVRAASQVEEVVGPFSIPIGPFASGGASEGRAVEGMVTIPKKYVGKKVVILGRSPKETRAVMVSASSISFKYRIGGFTEVPRSVYAFVDLDGNGARTGSEPYLQGQNGGWTVDLAPAEHSPVVRLPAPETVFVTANGYRYLGFADWYELCFAIRPAFSVLGGATVMNGPGISSPVDMSFAPERSYSECNAKVIVPKTSDGDSYTIRLEYLDGRIETQSAVVTGTSDFLVPIEPLGLLSDLQDQVFTWNSGNSVLANSPYFYGSDGYGTWSSTVFLPLGSDRYFLPDTFSQTQSGRNTWTIESHNDTSGSISRVTAPFYYGTGGVSAVVVERKNTPVTGVMARLEDTDSRAVVAEKTIENGEVSFDGVVPGRYRFCFEGGGFPFQCSWEVRYPYYNFGINVFAGETAYAELALYREDDTPSLPAAPLILNEGKEVTTTAEIPVTIPTVETNGDPLLIRYWWDNPYRGWWSDEAPSIVTVPGAGRHTLYVEFKNTAGRMVGASASVVLDNIPPIALFDRKPDPSAATSSCSFTLRQGDVVAYRAALDGGEFSDEIPVAQPFERAGLGYGLHTLAVLARDAAGNWQMAPSEYIWKVDVPTASVGLQESTKAWVATVQGEGVTMYRYRLGNGKYSSPRSASKPIAIRKNFTGSLSVVGRSANGTWQKLPTVIQIPPATK